MQCLGCFDVLGTVLEQCMHRGRFFCDRCFMMWFLGSDTTATWSPIMASIVATALRTLSTVPTTSNASGAYTAISPTTVASKTRFQKC